MTQRNETGEQADTLTGHRGWVLDLACAPDAHVFASSSSDKTVKFWDRRTKEVTHTITGHEDQVWGIDFSPDGKRLCSVSDDQSLRIHQRLDDT